MLLGHLHPRSRSSAQVDADARLLQELELAVELDQLERGPGPKADLFGRPVRLVPTGLSQLGFLAHD